MLSQISRGCGWPLTGHREGEEVNREASSVTQAPFLKTNKAGQSKCGSLVSVFFPSSNQNEAFTS